MTYECVAQDAYHYAQALSLDASGKRLMWETLPGQGSLLVQTPYGRDALRWRDEKDAKREFERFAELLSDECPVMPQGAFRRLSNGYWVRYVSAMERVHNDGCPSNGEACTYTVFACDYDASRFHCKVYAARGRGYMAAPCCDVPMKVRIGVAEVHTYKQRFFLFRWFLKPKREPLEFHAILFKDPCDKNYRDGDLQYCPDGRWKIPVTREMFESGTIFIRTQRKPEVEACNAGFEVVLSDEPPMRFLY